MEESDIGRETRLQQHAAMLERTREFRVALPPELDPVEIIRERRGEPFAVVVPAADAPD